MAQQPLIDLSNDPDVQVIDLSDDSDVVVQGGGLSQPPRSRGAGPMGTTQMGQAGVNAKLGAPNVGAFLTENLPFIAGTVASGVTAAATGGTSLIPQAFMMAGAAGGGAAIGSAGKSQLKATMTQIPQPPLKGQMVQDALVEGVLPEILSAGVGTAAHTAGAIRSRFGAATRNRETIDRITNPAGLRGVNASGQNMGQPIQQKIQNRRQHVFDPIKKGYSKLMDSGWGMAQRHTITDERFGGMHAPPADRAHLIPEPDHRIVDEVFDADGNTTAFTTEPDLTGWTSTPSGPTNAMRHERRSNALEDARAASNKANPQPKLARQMNRRAAKEYADMEQAAGEAGLSMDTYDRLGTLFRQATEKFDNTFMQQVGNKKGSDFITMLTRPDVWKSWKPKVEGISTGVKVDTPDLVQTLRATVDDVDWQALQTAVQKKLVFDAQDINLDVNPEMLEKSIKRMVAGGAKELIPQAQQMLEFAQILHNNTGGPLSVPGGKDAALGLVDRGLRATKLDNALTTPDVGRIMARRAKGPGYKGSGQQIIEWLTKAGVGTGLAASRDYTDYAIPEPPSRSIGPGPRR